MCPDANWPGIPNPLNITAADHANHRSPRGVPLPQDLLPNDPKAHKQSGLILKAARKPHLKAGKMGKLNRGRRRKKE
jgi:hypothetical protein